MTSPFEILADFERAYEREESLKSTKAPYCFGQQLLQCVSSLCPSDRKSIGSIESAPLIAPIGLARSHCEPCRAEPRRCGRLLMQLAGRFAISRVRGESTGRFLRAPCVTVSYISVDRTAPLRSPYFSPDYSSDAARSESDRTNQTD